MERLMSNVPVYRTGPNPCLAFSARSESIAQQRAAVAKARDWLERRDSPVFCLYGYAGTGKTTLAREIAEMTGRRVAFIAFTGKAALALRSKGCADATTIHRLIYFPVNLPNGGVEFFPKGKLQMDVELFILDECLMVDTELMADPIAH